MTPGDRVGDPGANAFGEACFLDLCVHAPRL